MGYEVAMNYQDISVERTAMVKTADGLGMVCQKVADVTADVVVEIDWNRLETHARRAVENRNGICRIANGAIRLRAKNIDVVRPTT